MTLSEYIEGPINSLLAQHKGSCELIKLDKGVAYLRLKGACKGCPGRQKTFLQGIKPMILENNPHVQDVFLEVE